MTAGLRQSLVAYLHKREDRFLNSIVVAALGGSPTFTPLRLADTPENQVFSAMEVDQSFGVLTFAGGERYYALDGQHRLAAVRAILNPTDNAYDKFAREQVTEEFRQAFREEEISVIMVVQDPDHDHAARADILRDYRRLFSSLNRYAKATEEFTNIIMDEDDAIAILTRRLITDHEFFKWTVEQPSEYSIIKISKGKNLRQTDPYFTQIEILYDMNKILLSSAVRIARGWPLSDNEIIPNKDYKKIWRINRPEDEILDQMYGELQSIWDGLLSAIPSLRNAPVPMRVHNPSTDEGERRGQDHALFWPVVQPMLAILARQLLDDFGTLHGAESLTAQQFTEALAPLGRIQWSLHEPPWRHLLLIRTGDNWIMRNEERTKAVAVAQEILEFKLGLRPLDLEGQASLRSRWAELLLPPQDETAVDDMWRAIINDANE